MQILFIHKRIKLYNNEHLAYTCVQCGNGASRNVVRMLNRLLFFLSVGGRVRIVYHKLNLYQCSGSHIHKS